MTRIHLSAGTLLICFLISCGENFLDVKADQTQRIPETIQDYMSIMDNTSSNTNPMNIRSSHTLGIIGGDEYYIPEQNYETFPTGLRFDYQKNAYTWNSRVYIGGEGGTLNPTDFETGYQRILRANLVLDGLDRIDPSPADQEAWDHTKGTALFHRAWNYYCLLQLYSPVYHDAISGTDMGMPFRTEADPTLKVPRASVRDCYELVIQDLVVSLDLLPESPLIKFRPGRNAALALLARVYLQMERYDLAVEYASRCIDKQNQLLDYNNIGAARQSYPFPSLGTENPEVIFVMTAFTAQAYSGALLAIGESFYQSYPEGDLRKKLFFEEESSGIIRYRGSYYGSELLFTGLALDEIYLIRAESRLRTGDMQGGLSDLNYLRINRIDPTTYQEISGENPDSLLRLILEERKKQLLLRGLRWEDIRRLNKDVKTAVILSRDVEGIRFELLPNDIRYVWPFPEEAIAYGGYVQNPR